jgi:hypothetical protein
MACAEADQGRASLEKQFDGLKLEVHRMNHLLERETMVNPTGKLGIIGVETASATLPVGATIVGPDGRRVDLTTRDHESGSVHTPTHDPTNGTSQTRSLPSSSAFVIEPRHAVPHGSGVEASRASQGRLPKL